MDEASIFAAALKLHEPQARAAFLDAACSGDAALRANVESLLAAHDEAGRFLEPAGSDQPATIDQPAPSETEGTVVGHYKLLQEIGEGGFGVVYMAEQQRPVRRKVAFKIIKPGMDTRDVIARFEAERQALAIMDHPNIAHVLDAGATDSGRPYFVMELVKGVPITEYCDKNNLTTQQRLELFVTVCQAVQHAHQKGVIHRDIKPSNIMVTLHDGKPVPKVIDFGVSKALNQQLTEKTLFTRYGQMVGTPAYMSPEQAEMSGLDVDTRSDIYSLGVLLYELLTGTTPLDANRLRETSYAEMQRIIREDEPQVPSTRLSSLGDSATIVAKHRNTDPRKLRQEFRGELDWIVMKALDKDRARRYETASALMADVARYLNGDAVEACPPSTTYRLRKFVRRYKPQVTVAAGFLLILVASSAVAWLLYADARRARNNAVAAQADLKVQRDRAIEAEQVAAENFQSAKTQRDRAEAEKSRADRQADELKLRLYDYNLTKAQAAYDREEIAGTLALLEDCLPEQRRWEWHRLQRLAGSQRTLKLSDSPFSAFAVSPTEARIVVFDDAAGVYRLFDLDTGQELASGETGLHSHVLATYSPAGDLVAVTSIEETDRTPTTTLQVWEAATGRKVWETRREKEAAYLTCFSPDARSLAFGAVAAAGKATVYLIDLEERTLIWQHSPTQTGLSITSFAPDGERLFVLVAPNPPPSRATLQCWSVDGPKELWSTSNAYASIPCPTPDGSQVIIAGANHSLQILDAADGSEIAQLSGSNSDIAGFCAFSPDGRYLVSQGHLGHRVVWDWAEKRIVNTLPNAETSMTQQIPPAFTPDSHQLVLATGSGAVEFRAIHPAPAQLILAGHEGSVKGVAFSPDGRQVASVSHDGTLRTWSTDTGQELQTLPAHPSAYDLAYSRDGTHIATGGSDGTKLWSTDTGRLVHHWSDSGSGWWVDFSPDGQQLITGGAGGVAEDGTKAVVSLYDVAGGECTFTRQTPYWIDGLVFGADGRRALSVAFKLGQLDIWDLESGESNTIRPGVLSAQHYRCLVRHPQGYQVALVVEDTIELWDINRRQLMNTLEADGETPYCLAFNHDGSRLFSGDTGGLVKVWNLDTGEVLFTLQAHEPTHTGGEGRRTGVHSLMLSPDGKTLATAGADGLVKLWETTRPSRALAQQRRIVRAATEAVNQRYRASPAHRDVLASLTADTSVDPLVLHRAIEIANARGDRPRGPLSVTAQRSTPTGANVRARLDEARRSFAALVEEISHADFDAVDPNSPEECDGRWVWDANYQLMPDFTLDELDYLLDPLVEQYPEAHQFLCLRGFVHGRKGRWREAEADFSTALKRVPEKSGLRETYAYVLAILNHHLGNVDRYNALCEQALQEARGPLDPSSAERTAKLYLFARLQGARINDAVRLARSAMGAAPHANYRWFSLASGIAEYRRGNWELTIEMLRQAQAPVGSQVATRLATAYLYQTLAYKHLKQHDRADEALAAAEQIMNRPGYGEDDWWNAFIAQAAHEEVRQLFADAGTDADHATAPDSAIAARRRAQRIVPPGSTWKWLHPADGIDPASGAPDFHETFFSLAYDDSHWPTASDRSGADGGFGYGDPSAVTLDVPAEGDRKTAYFRHRFTTDHAYDELILSLQRDDGVIVYLDGKEVGRNNVGDAAEAYDLAAQQEVAGLQETWVGFYPLSGALEPGEHVLTISLHNSAAQDSDLRIAEISLWGTPRDAPTDP